MHRAAWILGLACASIGCAGSVSPTSDLALRHVVLYQNGVAYFERTGALGDDKVHLAFKEREIDDVLKTLVVVEQGTRPAGAKPPTVTARLPQSAKAVEPDDATTLDVVITPRPERPVSIAYAVPSAAWKSAYRIVLPEGRGGKTALLQAWALVDNVTEEDWNDVALTLATGAPMTFSSHLRQPRFVARPDAPRLPEPTAYGPVVADGGRADRDGDGIPDALDKCPDQPGASSTDGCPQAIRRVGSAAIVILQAITFAKNSAVVTPAMRPLVAELASVLSSHPEIVRVTVQGHASNDEPKAIELGERRASAVRGALLAAGIAPARLRSTSFGSSQPIASNANEADRQKNRRVNLHIDSMRDEGKETADKPVVTQAGAAGTARGAATVSQAAGSYRYDLSNHVSIPRKSTAMVTIVNDNVPGEDILLYRPDPNVPGSDRAPMRAARVENRTTAGFLPGPVAMFAGGTFVGEGLLDRLNPGDTTFIPYGVDPASTMEVETHQRESPLRVVAIHKGSMTVDNRVTWTTRYVATIGTQAPARLFVRHPRRGGFTVSGPPAGAESGPTHVFVPMQLTPGKAAKLSIEETRSDRRVLPLASIEASALEAYLAGTPNLAAPIAARLREVVALRREMAKLDLTAEGLREQIADLGQRAGELKDSLHAIERTPRAAALQQDLVARLTETTKKSDALAAELGALGAKREAAREKVVEALRDLRLEEPSATP